MGSLFSYFPRLSYTSSHPQSYMALCMEHSVDADVDILFTEYTLNDGFENNVKKNSVTAGYERLVRRALALPNKPAVVMLHVSKGIGRWG